MFVFGGSNWFVCITSSLITSVSLSPFLLGCILREALQFRVWSSIPLVIKIDMFLEVPSFWKLTLSDRVFFTEQYSKFISLLSSLEELCLFLSSIFFTQNSFVWIQLKYWVDYWRPSDDGWRFLNDITGKWKWRRVS